MRLPAGWSESNRWDWDNNGNITSLKLAAAGIAMGINSWEQEGLGLKNTFPLISNNH